MRALADLVKLADRHQGRIPGSIPAHYVQWAFACHRNQRPLASPDGVLTPPLKKHGNPALRPRPAVIHL